MIFWVIYFILIIFLLILYTTYSIFTFIKSNKIKSATTTNNLTICAECGGEIRLLGGKKRLREYRKGVNLPIPDNYLIPTCIACKEESMTPEVSKKLDALLQIIYENFLLSEIKKFKKIIAESNNRWYDNREIIGKASWIIPGPGKPISYLDLSEDQKEKFNIFVKELTVK